MSPTSTCSLAIDAITVSEGRRCLRDLDALADSIRAVGLLQPIVVTQSDHRLVAGLHRLEACRRLGWTAVPVNLVTLDDLDRELAEIDENLIRAELTVLERAEQLARRKEIYEAKFPETKQHVAGGKAKAAKPASEIISVAGDEPASFAQDTAAKTKASPRTVQHEVQIANKIAPEVRDAIRGTRLADSKTDLLKLARLTPAEQRRTVKTIATGEASTVQEALFEHAKKKVAKEAQQQREVARVRRADAVTFLNGFATGSVDLLITDPPYMTDVDDIRRFAASWVPLAIEKIKPTGRAYICTGAYPAELNAYLSLLLGQSAMALASVLVWTYRNTLGPAPKHDYKQNWQAIFHLRGPEAPPLDCPLMNEQFSVQDINAPDGRLGNRYHPWQKPDELAERLIRHSTRAGDLVIDPFAGTGTFLLAAARLGRKAMGGDNSDESLAIAVERGCRREG